MLGCFLLLGAPWARCAAQLPAARLAWVFPPGAAPGQTLEVTAAGEDLEDPVALRFTDPRITASPREPGSATFRVTVPDGVPAGTLDVRFAGRFGVSNPRRFLIGGPPAAVAPGTNTAPSSAWDVPAGTPVDGRLAPARPAWFRFRAGPGSPVRIRVHARALDSRLVPDLMVRTEDGRELATARRREELEFLAPEAGAYLLRLSDQIHRGGDDFLYRLEIGAGPACDFVLPLAAVPGQPAEIEAYGRGLGGGASGAVLPDGRPLQRIVAPVGAGWETGRDAGLCGILPAAAAVSGHSFPTWRPEGFPPGFPGWPLAPTALPVRVVRAGSPASLEPPAEISGLLPHAREVAAVEFESRQGEVWWIEVLSARLGFPADPHAVVQRLADPAAGRWDDVLELSDSAFPAGGREVELGHRDPVGRFEAPAEGRYRVRVRDLFRAATDEAGWPYRLIVRRPEPRFSLAAYPATPPRRDDNDRRIPLQTLLLRPGDTVPLRVLAVRHDGFDGPIEVSATGLPGGVEAMPVRIGPGRADALLLLSASAEAAVSEAAFRVVGRAEAGGRAVVREAVPMSARRAVADWDQERSPARVADEFVLAVRDGDVVPVAVSPATTEHPVAAGGTVGIPLVIRRGPDTAAAFKVRPAGVPGIEKAPELDIPEGATNAVYELNLGTVPLPAGEHGVHFEGWFTGKHRRDSKAAPDTAKDVTFRVHSRPVRLRVTAAPAP